MTEKATGSLVPRWRPVLGNRWLIGGVVAVTLYALAGFLLLPHVLARYVPHLAQEHLDRRASVDEVRINPFLLTLDVRGFALAETDGAPIFGFAHLFVDLEMESLFRWAWTFAEIRIDQPSIDLVVGEDDRLNLAKLADALPPPEPSDETEPAADEPPIRMLLEHVVIAGGRASLTDRTQSTPAAVVVEPLDFEFKEISTLPQSRGPYSITATLPSGGTLGWKGEVSLHPIASSGAIVLEGLDVARVWPFFQNRLDLATVEGKARLDGTYRFSYRDGVTTLTADGIGLGVQAIALTRTGATEPMLSLEEITLSDASFDLGERRLAVPRLGVRGGKVTAATDASGAIDWQQIVIARPTPGTANAPAAAAPADPGHETWHVDVDDLAIGEVALHYRDESRASPVTAAIGDIGVKLALRAAAGGGALDLRVEDISVALRDIGVNAGADGASLLALDAVELAGGILDVAGSRADVERITVTGGGTRIRRAADGSLPQLETLASRPGAAAPATSPPEEPTRPWQFNVAELAVNGFALGIEDQSTEPALAYDFDDVQVVLRHVSNDGSTPIDYDAKVTVAQGGTLHAAGAMSQSGDSVDGEIEIDKVNLEPLHPMVARFAALALKGGTISSTAKVGYQATDAGPSVQAKGTLAVDGLLLQENESGERFAAWKRLSVQGLDFSLAPDRLAIDEIRLQEPGAKIVVFKDKRINLATVLAGNAGGTGTSSAAAEEKAASASARVDPFPVSVDRLRVEKGIVDFADLSLVLPFATEIQALEGSVIGISSDAASRATMKLEGKVGEFGRANADGSLAPFDPKQFTDLKVRFENVVMTPLSPYTATFAGRKIASGKLDLDLNYKIANSQMLGENSVVLRELALGETVESPDAANLPLDLAIALMTDSEGKIDVRLPVIGNVDDPEFSYGHLVWQAITNLITKIVTAPFSALAAALGGDAEDMQSVAFDAGRAEVSPPEREKLAKVTEALAKRPQLKLTVHGAYADVDAVALKDRAVRAALATELGAKVAPGEDPGPVALENAKTQIALEELFERMGGEGAMKTFQAAYESNGGKEAGRVNKAFALFGKGSEDRDFYLAIYARLAEGWPLAPDALEHLGRARADAVVSALQAQGMTEPARIAAGDVQPADAAEVESVTVKLTLDVVD